MRAIGALKWILWLSLIFLVGARLGAAEFEVMDKLSVNGGVRISTSATAVPVIFASSTTNQGNVGIGTTVPGARLHVSGGGSVSGVTANTQAVVSNTGAANSVSRLAIIGGQSGGAVLDLGVANDTDFFSITLDTTSTNPLVRMTVPDGSGASILTLANTSNVGIGSAAPSKKLDVGGDINLAGNLFASGVQGAVFGGTFSIDANTGACRRANPLTAACTCPSGFTMYDILVAVNETLGTVNLRGCFK